MDSFFAETENTDKGENILHQMIFFATRRVVDVDDLENQSFERNGDFKKSVFSKFQ